MKTLNIFLFLSTWPGRLINHYFYSFQIIKSYKKIYAYTQTVERNKIEKHQWSVSVADDSATLLIVTVAY